MVKTTQRHLTLVSGTASQNGMTVPVDRLVSQANSKLYRQGMNYHCRVSLIVDAAPSSDVEYEIFTLPTDHRTIGALRMAKSIYNQAMKDELEIRPEVKSPWTDFKMEVCDISDTSLWDPLLAEAKAVQWRVAADDKPGQYVKLISDDYPISQITSNAGAQKTFSLTDATSTNYWNIFTEYINYLTNRADPDSAAEVAAYEAASPVLTELEELADKGDQPPYSWNWESKKLDGTTLSHDFQVTHAGTISVGTMANRQNINQFVDCEAPLGLIFIKSTVALSTSSPELMVTLKPGNYKGVKADRIYPRDKLLGF